MNHEEVIAATREWLVKDMAEKGGITWGTATTPFALGDPAACAAIAALSVAGLKARTPNQGETELKFDAAMSASDRERLQQADFQSLSASEFNLVEKLARRVKLPLPQIQGRRTRAGGRGERMHWASAPPF